MRFPFAWALLALLAATAAASPHLGRRAPRGSTASVSSTSSTPEKPPTAAPYQPDNHQNASPMGPGMAHQDFAPNLPSGAAAPPWAESPKPPPLSLDTHPVTIGTVTGDKHPMDFTDSPGGSDSPLLPPPPKRTKFRRRSEGWGRAEERRLLVARLVLAEMQAGSVGW